MQWGTLYCLGLLCGRVLCTLTEMSYGILLGYIIWIFLLVVNVTWKLLCMLVGHVICSLFTDHHWEELGRLAKKGEVYSVVFMPKPEVLAIHL